jgi:ankyrin repeat protein
MRDSCQDGESALMWAAQNGHANVVRILMNAAANVHMRNQVSRLVCFIVVLFSHCTFHAERQHGTNRGVLEWAC